MCYVVSAIVANKNTIGVALQHFYRPLRAINKRLFTMMELYISIDDNCPSYATGANMYRRPLNGWKSIREDKSSVNGPRIYFCGISGQYGIVLCVRSDTKRCSADVMYRSCFNDWFCNKTCCLYLFVQVCVNSLWPSKTLQWRHNERDDVSNHQRLDCFLNRLFRRRSKKTLKLHVIGLCEGEFTGNRWISLTKGQ